MLRIPSWLSPVIACILVVVMGLAGLGAPLRGGALTVLSPFRRTGVISGQFISQKLQFFRDILFLRQENVYLREQLRQAYSQLAYYRPLEQENQLLRKQLAVIRLEPSPPYVLAKVTGRSFGQATRLVFDQGSLSGVSVGDPVLYERYLIGKVGEVYDRQCLVYLVVDPDFSVAVVSQGSGGGVRGIARGNYGTSLVLERVLNEAELAVGEMLTTSGEGEQFPPGLIVGQVEEIFARDADTLKQANLKTVFNVSELKEAMILVE